MDAMNEYGEKQMKEKNRQSDTKDNLIISIVGIVVFCIMLLILLGSLVSKITNSISQGDLLFQLATIFVILVGIIFIRIVKKYKWFKVVILILDGISFILVYFILMNNMLNFSQVATYRGNNSHVSSYNKGYGGPTYSSVEEANTVVLEGKEGSNFKDYKELYRVSEEHYVWTFYQYDKGLISVELYAEDGRYYDRGTLLLVYGSDSFTYGKYSEEETIRADISNSLFYGMSEKDRTCPVWGVTENDGIGEAAINGVKADYVEALTGKDGKTYYFWVIEDIGNIKKAEDIAGISITMP